MITQLAGNGRVLLTLNDSGEWENLYYPYPGQFQHLREMRLGVYDVDRSKFHWLRPDNGLRHIGRLPGVEEYPTTVWEGDDLRLVTEELVHPNHDLLLRIVRLHSASPRRLRLFSYQSFMITESMYQETAYLDPSGRSLVHFKRGYYFELFGDPAFDRAVCGEHTLKGLKGTYVDAEDGQLEGRTIAHGAADSVLQWDLAVVPGADTTIRLGLAIGRSLPAVHQMRDDVRAAGGSRYEAESKAYWQSWVSRHLAEGLRGVGDPMGRLVRSSVRVLKQVAGANGSIIASPDLRSLLVGGDSYNYCWWRDGGYVSQAMDVAGLSEYAERFLKFAQKCQGPDRSFAHRHFPDGEFGSTWHPPPFLQIDQTATVVRAAWHHLGPGVDPDTILEVWPMVKSAANFLAEFRDPATGLPGASFDLWEERFGIHTYSVAAVADALERAADLADALGKDHARWRVAAEEIREAALQHLWDPALGRFIRSIAPRDERIDASSLLALDLDLLPPADPRFRATLETVEARLWSSRVGGVARYEGDEYYGRENPWIICTLWLANGHLRLGDAARCRALLDWVVEQATPTGLLPEQVDSESRAPKSATPLAWSHAAFLDSVHRYERATSASAVGSTGRGPPA